MCCDAWLGMLCILVPGSPEHDAAIGEVIDRLPEFGAVNRAEGRPLRPSYLVGHFTRRPLLDENDAMIAAAGVLERRKKYTEAMDLLESCVTRGDPWYLARGAIFHQMGRYSGALQSLRVVNDESSRIEADYWMGLSSLMTGSVDAAAALLESVAARTSRPRLRGQCEYYLAHCFRLRGDEASARLMFDRAWQVMPSDRILDDRDDPQRRLRVPGVDETGPTPAPREPIGVVLDDLDALAGLTTVKDQIQRIVARQVMDRERGRSPQVRSRHVAFLTSPGAGTSTVARIIARAHYSLGVLPRGRVIEASGPALLADTPTATARRVNDVIDRAMGAVLLIDDAPEVLGAGDLDADRGAAAVGTLIKRMHEERDRLIVILSGAPGVLEPLIDRDDRLRELLPTRLRFDAYSVDELLAVVDGLALRERVTITDSARGAEDALRQRPDEHRGDSARHGPLRSRSLRRRVGCRDVRRFRERNTTGRDDEDVIDADDVRAAFEMLRRELDPA